MELDPLMPTLKVRRTTTSASGTTIMAASASDTRRFSLAGKIRCQPVRSAPGSGRRTAPIAASLIMRLLTSRGPVIPQQAYRLVKHVGRNQLAPYLGVCALRQPAPLGFDFRWDRMDLQPALFHGFHGFSAFLCAP